MSEPTRRGHIITGDDFRRALEEIIVLWPSVASADWWQSPNEIRAAVERANVLLKNWEYNPDLREGQPVVIHGAAPPSTADLMVAIDALRTEVVSPPPDPTPIVLDAERARIAKFLRARIEYVLEAKAGGVLAKRRIRELRDGLFYLVGLIESGDYWREDRS